MRRRGPFHAGHGLDLLVCAAAAEAAIHTATRDDLDHTSGPVHWFLVAALAGLVLVLLLRRWYPFAAPATTWVGSAALSFVDGQLIANQAGIFLAGLGAAVLLGTERRVLHGRVGLAIVLSGAALVVLNQPGHVTADLVFIPLLFSIGWVVGFALRQRTEQTEAAEERALRAEREREAAARLAVAEERSRIAREIHDVVAHAVSVMVLQVGAVRHRMSSGSVDDREALRNVEEAGRTALTEMRRLLAAMREDGEQPELVPHPGLDDLDRLVHDVGATGLEVRVEVRGEPAPLPPGVDLSAYRIVQEGLTNSLRHAGTGRADVTVEYDDDSLLLEVRDRGQRVPSSGDGRGHGLVGIRERVKIFGGDMSAGPAPGGGFLLRVRLPLQGERQ